MILGRGEADDGSKVLVVGLSQANVGRLLRGMPIRVTRRSHGDALPDDWELVIFAGETEESMAAQLRQGGMIDEATPVFKEPRLGRGDDT